jgi:hypothetical protein
MLESRNIDTGSREEATRPEVADDLRHRVKAAAPDLAIIIGFVVFALLLVAAALR